MLGLAAGVSGIFSAMTTARPLCRGISTTRIEPDYVHARFKMPVNMTMQEPRARVVSNEAERNVVVGTSDVHHITTDGVGVIVRRASSNAYDVKGVSVEMEGML